MSMLFYFTILKHYFINIPYHFTISLHRKTLFLLKYYFLTHSLLFLPPNRSASFSWAFQQPFLFLPPSTDSTHNTHPLYTNQPIQTHHHTHTHKHIHQPSNKATHKHNPATKPSHTHKHKPIKKPGHQSKTQARPPIHAADQPIHVADLKPRPPIKNRSKSIQKKSSPEPPQPQPNHDHDPLQPPIHDQRPPSAADP